MAKLIDGKAVAAEIREGLKTRCKQLSARGIVPGLAVILVGDDPASRVYVNNKKKACEVCGIKSYEYALPAETWQQRKGISGEISYARIAEWLVADGVPENTSSINQADIMEELRKQYSEEG